MVWNFQAGDLDRLRNILSCTRWDSVFSKTDVNEMTSEFMDISKRYAKPVFHIMKPQSDQKANLI